MEGSETNLEREFSSRMADFFSGKELRSKYGIVSQPNLAEYTTDRSFKNRRADFIILKGSYPFMIVEIKRPVVNLINSGYLQNAAFELELTGADYFVITDLRNIIIIDSVGKEPMQSDRFEDIFGYFDEGLNEKEIENLKTRISEQIQRIASESELPESQEAYLGSTVKAILLEQDLSEKITYNSEGRFFHFSTNPQLGLDDFENKFFQGLLKPVTDQVVCRYTTFDSLYQMLKNQTFRMSSDIAMNDRGEIDYVDKYIGLFYTPLQSLSIIEMQQMNNSYISSCTTIEKEDDLTMYRLYAEDSKGVCLCFNVTNGLQSRYMLLKKISYAIGPGNHPELDLIKNIINTLSGSLRIRFRFLYLDVWKHFFKTHDYAIEAEVRLLYLENASFHPTDKGWVVTNPDRILSKYVLFGLGTRWFPLGLYKIILGPNCPEAQLNRRQLEVLLHEKGIIGVLVENSKIESYRKN